MKLGVLVDCLIDIWLEVGVFLFILLFNLSNMGDLLLEVLNMVLQMIHLFHPILELILFMEDIVRRAVHFLVQLIYQFGLLGDFVFSCINLCTQIFKLTSALAILVELFITGLVIFSDSFFDGVDFSF